MKFNLSLSIKIIKTPQTLIYVSGAFWL